MRLINQTEQEITYTISSSNAVDCGNIDGGKQADWPGYDNSANVKVRISAAYEGNSVQPFQIEIPETGIGKAVTIGLFFE